MTKLSRQLSVGREIWKTWKSCWRLTLYSVAEPSMDPIWPQFRLWLIWPYGLNVRNLSGTGTHPETSHNSCHVHPRTVISSVTFWSHHDRGLVVDVTSDTWAVLACVNTLCDTNVLTLHFSEWVPFVKEHVTVFTKNQSSSSLLLCCKPKASH